METRKDHLDLCKKNALIYLKAPYNNTVKAFTSFVSDMQKHVETRDHIALEMGMPLLVGGHLSTVQEMETWINDFN